MSHLQSWERADTAHRLCYSCGVRRVHSGALCYDCDEGTGQSCGVAVPLYESGRRAAEFDLAQGPTAALALLPSILARNDDYSRGYAEMVHLVQWLQLEVA